MSRVQTLKELRGDLRRRYRRLPVNAKARDRLACNRCERALETTVLRPSVLEYPPRTLLVWCNRGALPEQFASFVVQDKFRVEIPELLEKNLVSAKLATEAAERDLQRLEVDFMLLQKNVEMMEEFESSGADDWSHGCPGHPFCAVCFAERRSKEENKGE